MQTNDMKLRCQLKGHDDDVRAVTACAGLIVTCSRDKTIKTWREHPDASIGQESTLVSHSDYVVALAPLQPGQSPAVPGAGLISGSRDTTAVVWDLETGNAVQTLSGHKYQVNAVGVLASGEVASAGLDGTLKVWKGGKCIRTCEGHEGAILCLLVLPSGDILTGSGDKTIKQWSGNMAHSQYMGHTDSVRALCLLPDVGFVSASHDASLRIWSFQGEQLGQLLGHSSLVYCCAASPAGLIASGSEDNTMRTWNMAGECLQTIPHPGSVWSVAFLPSGDVVSACSDASAYVWSAAPERQAAAGAQAAYDSVIAERAAAANAAPSAGDGNAGIPEDQIFEASALLMPGAKDNETKIIRKEGKLWAYAWTAGTLEWSVLGEVTTGPGEGDDSNVQAPAKWHNGREWDFLFDVDVSDGQPHLKMPMNRGEDPYDVADRFMEDNGLPASYREQIVSFVIQNAGQACGSNLTGTNTDPFTGAGAYVPSSGPQANANFSGAGGDPFTGGGAYVPGSAPGGGSAAAASASDVTGGGCDPYTGRSATAAAPQKLMYTPYKEYQHFEARPPVDKLAAKLKEFSAALPAAAQISDAEAAPGGALAAVLTFAGASTDAAQGELLAKMSQWPAEQLFPVLDVFRVLVLDETTATSFVAAAGALNPASSGLGGMLARGLAAGAPAPTQLMALRTACNCCKVPALRAWLLADADRLLDCAAELCATQSRPVRTAVVTVLLNFSVAVATGAATEEHDCRMRILSMLTEVLGIAGEEEHDCQFRALLTAATIAHGNKTAAELGADLGIADMAVTIGNRFRVPEKLVVVSRDVQLVLVATD